MKILVTGARGQVGYEFADLARRRGLDVVGTDASNLDITDAVRVQDFIAATKPGWVVNAAAWTAVDKAETESDTAYVVNALGARNIASACAKCSVPLLHFSTDYVFDGEKIGAYTERDVPRPLSVYGRTKLAGEQAIRDELDEHIVLRTSWVFSARGSNFVKTMLRLGVERQQINVVADQVGKPTSAARLAELALSVIHHRSPPWGTYHAAQSPAISWHGFATEIFARGRALGVRLAVENTVPIATSEFPSVAARPRNSELDCTLFEHTFEIGVGDWHDALPRVMEDIVNGGIFA